MYTIYLITNKVNGKVYVGQTRQKLGARWNGHKRDAKTGSLRICRAIRKYGPESFTIEEIATAETQEWADYLERVWIVVYDSRNKDTGYNIREGGNHSPGMSVEGRESLRQKNLGRPVSQEIREAASLRMKKMWKIGTFKGVPHTEEAKAKMKESHKGSKHNTFRRDIFSEELVSLWNHDVPTKALSEHFKISRAMVYKRIKLSGLPHKPFDSRVKGKSRRPALSVEEKEEVIRLTNLGVPQTRIAEQFCCHQSTISHLFKKLRKISSDIA